VISFLAGVQNAEPSGNHPYEVRDSYWISINRKILTCRSLPPSTFLALEGNGPLSNFFGDIFSENNPSKQTISAKQYPLPPGLHAVMMQQKQIAEVMENSLSFITSAPEASEFFGMPLAPTLYSSALEGNEPLSNFFREIIFWK
jgi:hypothetical protein